LLLFLLFHFCIPVITAVKILTA